MTMMHWKMCCVAFALIPRDDEVHVRRVVESCLTWLQQRGS